MRCARSLVCAAVVVGMVCGLTASLTPASADEGVVRTDAGELRGATTATGADFLGVPFAQPPVGDLRWRAPRPVQPWSGVRDATRPGPACAQTPSPIGGLPGGSVSEDCLYLNVYTPAGVKPGERLPVMLWLHGGAFVWGAGSLYDPGAMADTAHMVVVTTNYRLGALGFLALPGLSAEDPALNYGIQDQQAALRWVRHNIAGFGGDTGRVTLFGESAGGASVCDNLVSPGSAGLFQRAIVQSGPCGFGVPGKRAPADIYATSRDFAGEIGCPDGPDQLTCLRGKSVPDLLKGSPDPGNLLDGTSRWGPVIDGRVLPGDPLALIKADRFHHVPVMIGTDHDEGRLFTFLAYDRAGRTLTTADYRKVLLTMAGSPAAAEVLGAVYSPQRYGSPVKAFSALITDAGFSFGTTEVARATSQHVPTFAYEFNDPDAPLTPLAPALRIGAYHGSELQYLFAMPSTPLLDDNQKALSTKMIAHWTNFATTGDPNKGTAVPAWPRYTPLTPTVRNLAPGDQPATLFPGTYRSEHNIPLWQFISTLHP